MEHDVYIKYSSVYSTITSSLLYCRLTVTVNVFRLLTSRAIHTYYAYCMFILIHIIIVIIVIVVVISAA